MATPAETDPSKVQRLTEKEWDMYKDTLYSLYVEKNFPLHQVRRRMKEEYGFNAS